MEGQDRLLLGNRASFAAAASLVAVATAGLVVLAIVSHLRPLAVLVLLLAILGGVLGLLGWRRAVRVATIMARADERHEREADRVEASREELEREVGYQRDAREAEHAWNRRLRERIYELQRERGAFGSTDDIGEHVLRVAVELLHAEKGLLLSRADEDADGNLDLVCSVGFRADPAESAIAQRFAERVIREDETIREDDPGPKPTAADREIENLVAIPIYMQDAFSGVVVAANKAGGFHDYDDEVLLALGDHAGAVLQNGRLHGELRTAYLTTVNMLAAAIEAKDPFLRRHAEDASRYVGIVAERLGMERPHLEDLTFASLLHDVGKIGISERILLKPAALTAEERSIIELHPRIGYRIVQQVPALRSLALALLHHHERWDGEGYPAGLSGGDIPLEARIISVADAFSAMTTDRPYREARTVEQACAELERCAGTQFDPEIVRLFVEEVRAEPPLEARDLLAEALSDPELASRRKGDEPLLGYEAASLTDSLTLLYSHRALHEVARAEAERAAVQRKPFGLVVVELTDLERVNADESYAAGDGALRLVARGVEQVAGRCGGTAARLSGSRLALLCPATSESDVDQLAEEVGHELTDGPSVSVRAVAWREGESGEDVIARALAPAPTAL